MPKSFARSPSPRHERAIATGFYSSLRFIIIDRAAKSQPRLIPCLLSLFEGKSWMGRGGRRRDSQKHRPGSRHQGSIRTGFEKGYAAIAGGKKSGPGGVIADSPE